MERARKQGQLELRADLARAAAIYFFAAGEDARALEARHLEEKLYAQHLLREIRGAGTTKRIARSVEMLTGEPSQYAAEELHEQMLRMNAEQHSAGATRRLKLLTRYTGKLPQVLRQTGEYVEANLGARERAWLKRALRKGIPPTAFEEPRAGERVPARISILVRKGFYAACKRNGIPTTRGTKGGEIVPSAATELRRQLWVNEGSPFHLHLLHALVLAKVVRARGK
jgi:hypothetical protein